MPTAPSLPTSRTRRWAYRETRVAATLRGSLVAVLIEHDDRTCTVWRVGVWHTFTGEPEEWSDREKAVQAVELATGEGVSWSEMAHTRGRTERLKHGLPSSRGHV